MPNKPREGATHSKPKDRPALPPFASIPARAPQSTERDQMLAVRDAQLRHVGPTEQQTKVLCAALMSGHYMNVAAPLAGLSVSSVKEWLSKAARDDAPESLVDFAMQVSKANAIAEKRLTDVIVSAAVGNPDKGKDPDWRAALTVLERRFSQRWGRQDHLTVGGDEDAPVTIQLTWPGGNKDADS